MADPEHLAILDRGVVAWNRWRLANPGVRPDLSGAGRGFALLGWVQLAGANLRRADLSGAWLMRGNLSGADLSEAILHETDFRRADLARACLARANISRADLSWSNLSQANLADANLHGANLSGANLREAILNGAVLTGANLSRARAWGTSFANLDLSEARGLEAVEHWGPSCIGIDTLYRSAGCIPPAFLRGAGVPDQFAALVAPLVGHAVQTHAVVISHATRDQAFVEQLYADLQAANVRCWFALEYLKSGDRARTVAVEALGPRDRLLLVLSRASAASQWVALEVEAALERERREGRQVLVPLRLDDAIMESDATWATALKGSRPVADFRAWRDEEAYCQALAGLLREIGAHRTVST